MTKIVGVIYPVPIHLLDRLFVEHRNIFVKYIARPTKVRIAPGNKLLLYASHGLKEIVGEALIKNIEFLTPFEVVKKYGNTVFLSDVELASYTRQQPTRTDSRKMLVLTLSKPRKYRFPIKHKPITMAGQYLTQDIYNSMFF